MKLHASFYEPAKNIAALAVADSHRFEVERALTEAFLENTCRMQQVVGNDCVEHTHAAFIKDAHQGLALLELASDAFAELQELARQLHFAQSHHMACVVVDAAAVQPGLHFLYAALQGSLIGIPIGDHVFHEHDIAGQVFLDRRRIELDRAAGG